MSEFESGTIPHSLNLHVIILRTIPLNQPIDRQQPNAAYPQQHNDGISVIDLALILIRQKKIIFITLIACVALSVAAIFLISPKQTFTTTIKIGGNPPVEAGDTTVAKITEAYIPMLEDNRIGIEAKNPKGTNLIILQTTTLQTNHEKVQTAHQAIADMVVASQNQRLDQLTDQWTQEVAIYENSLRELENNQYLLSLEKEIAGYRSQLQSNEVAGNTSSIKQLRTKLGLLQDNYSKELAQQREHKLTVQTNIADIRNKLITIEKTAALNTAVITKETPTRIALILSLGVILGIIGGVFMAFFAEFICKVREALLNEKQT